MKTIWVEWVEWVEVNFNGGNRMIAKQDIENVKAIIQKTKQFSATTEIEKSRFDKLFRELDVAGNKFIKEVTSNVRLS